ncbi:MAG: aminoacyl-tRNA hydrolase [Candidatus Nanopelagicales bacterium]
MTEKKTWLIVGLGNPGTTYAGTRHNIGASAVTELANSLGEKLAKHKRVNAAVAETRLAGLKVILANPLSYMNESGGPVSGLMKYYDLAADSLVVLHDELDIPALALRVKFGGGDNGHNGLKSIRASIGTGDYYRVRMGIGRPVGAQDPADFVLKNFSTSEKPLLAEMFDRTEKLIESLMLNGLAATQNEFHRGDE